MIAKIILTQLLFAIRYKIRLCNNFLSVVYCLTPVLSEIVWIDKLHSCVKKSVSSRTVVMETRKRKILNYSSSDCKWIIYIQTTTENIELTEWVLGQKKLLQQGFKTWKTFLYFKTTFYNFLCKIQIRGATRVP